MDDTQKRNKLRALINGTKSHSPASVFDALSARIAQAVGYDIGLLAGSVVAATTLAAPDVGVHTSTEFADQIRRITRVCDLSLFVDADHAYGNALNVMRTVHEFEHAGVAALSIEDTELPRQFGVPDGVARLIGISEGVGKIRAALAARKDPALVIAARTSALMLEGIESALARVNAYAATGVDMIFIAGKLDKLEHLQAIYQTARLPMFVTSNHGDITRTQLEANGARILNCGHQIVAAVAKAMRDTYRHLYAKGAPSKDLVPNLLTPEEMAELTRTDQFDHWMGDFLRPSADNDRHG